VVGIVSSDFERYFSGDVGPWGMLESNEADSGLDGQRWGSVHRDFIFWVAQVVVKG
jgi:hypothetical protein